MKSKTPGVRTVTPTAISRRAVIGGGGLLSMALFAGAARPFGTSAPGRVGGKGRLFCYVGSWTEGKNGAGEHGGLHVFQVTDENGLMSHVQSLDPEINAGYLALSPDMHHLYANDERKDFGGSLGAGGSISAYEIDPETGALTRKNTVRTMGAFPAYVSVSPNGQVIAVANHGGYDPATRIVSGGLERIYDDATVSLFLPGADGTITEAVAIGVLDRGPGPGYLGATGLVAMCTSSPHAHSVNWDPSGHFIVVCDKGADRIYSFRVEGTQLERVHVFYTPPGTAPRHSAFHPTLPFLFIVNELKPTLSLYKFNTLTGSLSHITTVRMVDRDDTPGSPTFLPADVRIHPTLPVVYASARGSDSIAVYQFIPEPAQLRLLQIISTGGATPRSFNIEPSGRLLFVGNQDSGSIVPFQIDRQTGKLTPTNIVTALKKPVCIKFAVL